MSIKGLLDHRGVIYRNTVTRDELRDTNPHWAPLSAPAGKNCRPNQNWSGSLQDAGPGEKQSALRQWFLDAGFDVQERDVLQIVEGPEIGALLWIESVTRPTAPRMVHHLEVNVRVWDGALTA